MAAPSGRTSLGAIGTPAPRTPKPKKSSPPLTEAVRGTLSFTADFESGNLGGVRQRGNGFEYDIFVRQDALSPNHRVWFFFRVTNYKAGQRVVFHIVNFSKHRSLFRDGMTPLVCTDADPLWRRIPCDDSFYYKKNPTHVAYVFSWAYRFGPTRAGGHYFAYCYPYTYTDLQRFLFALDQMDVPFYRRDLLTRTVQHRRLDVLTITSPCNLPLEEGPKKKMVIVTARVHPGETPASFMCHGLVEYLVGDHVEAQRLRDFLVFKIVPMVNPDGVFLGNYRTSSLGQDLNRFWRTPSKWEQPTILALKTMALEYGTHPNVDVDFFLDLHSHSTEKNGFMYINKRETPAAQEREALYPRLLEVNSREFRFGSLRYDENGKKHGTGRRTLGEEVLPRSHCYTLEISFFCSCDPTTGVPVPYTREDYGHLGRCLGETFLDFYGLRPETSSS